MTIDRPSIAKLRKSVVVVVFCLISMAALPPAVAAAQMPASVPGDGQVISSPVHFAPLSVSQPVGQIWLPLMAHNRCGSALASADSVFGVQVYGYLGPKSPYYCELVDSGASWVRNVITWNSVEPKNVDAAAYRWDTADGVVKTATQGGFNLLITITGNPSWAATYSEGPIDKAPLTEFVSFVGALVERYDGDGIDDAPGSPKVVYWEFFNEPDRSVVYRSIRWGHHGREYAEMLAAVYPAVKAANPSAKVLLGGVAYDWFEDQDGPFVREFLDDVLENGGGRYFDIMNFHHYPSFAANWGAPNGPGLVEKAQAVRAKLAQFGLEKPLVISESGMHSNDANSSSMTPELQARYVTMLFSQTVAADVDILIWFMLYDPDESYPFRNGLVTAVSSTTQQPERKPSFVAYQTAASMLTGVVFDRELTVAETGNEDMIVYRNMDQHGQILYVAWLGPITREDSATLTVPGSHATVLDIYGTARTVADGDDGETDEKITISVGAQPVYVQTES